MSRASQLVDNVNYLIGEYLNEMEDNDLPALSEESCLLYVKSQIFDIKVRGCSCSYNTGICDDLKFLGTEYIDEVILKSAREDGILA